MASASDESGAPGADRPEDENERQSELFAGLPSRLGPTPAAPALADRLDAAPEDASERFAFALWNAGRKDEAVEFLERQIERHRADAPPSADTVTGDSVSPREDEPAEPKDETSGNEWAGPTLSLAPNISVPPRDIPPPPFPRRPLVIVAAVVVLLVAFVWPGYGRIAALPGWLGLAPSDDFVADSADAPATTGATAPAETAAVEVDTDTRGGSELPPVRIIGGDNVTGAPRSARAAPGPSRGEDPHETELASEPEPVIVEPEPDDAGSPEVAAAEDWQPPASPSPAPPPPETEDELVTLQELAIDVEIGPRVPRPRPEPSPETVAAVTAPEPVRPAPIVSVPPSPPEDPYVVAEREDDYVVDEPGPTGGSLDNGPYATDLYQPVPPPPGTSAAAAGPQEFQVIGRVMRPGLAWRRAAAERYLAARRAWAERHAEEQRPAPYYSGPYAGPYAGPPPGPPGPYVGPYPPQPTVPWASPPPPSWSGGPVAGY